jgi:hypothetical protein
MNALRRTPDARLDGPPRLIVPDGREQVDLGVAPAELRERDAAAPAGEEARIAQVNDVTRAGNAVGAPQRHVLDVAHDGDAGAATGRECSLGVAHTRGNMPRFGHRVPCARMPTLVLSHRYSPDSNALFAAALAAGWDVERLRSFRCPEGLAERDPVFYGETLLADAIAGDLGIALLEPSADWLPRLPERHRRRDVRLMTLSEALAIRERAFVKPTDEKCFPARVYADGAAIDPDPVLPQDLPVLVSEPVVFEVEFRFFVLEREAAARSPYIRGGEIARSAAGDWEADASEIEAASASIHALLTDPDVELPAAVVVDVGRMAGRGWGVVEANAAWASGLCGCDPARVLPVLRRAAVPRGGASKADQRWVRRVG